jgi:hypothetical protein
MLKTATEFPHAGSFALYVDTAQPPRQQRAELVRIQRRYSQPAGDAVFEMAAVSFPLRQGASGNLTVKLDQLIDGTLLDHSERREHADLERHLKGRERLTPKLKAQLLRAEKLRSRAIFSMVLESELAKLRSLEARAEASPGTRLPNEVVR